MPTRLTIDRKLPDPKRVGMGQVVEKREVLNQNSVIVLFAEHIYLVQMKEPDDIFLKSSAVEESDADPPPV